MRRLGGCLGRAGLALLILLFVLLLPLPVWTPNWFVRCQVPLLVFLFVVYLGKLLLDTIIFPEKKP